MRRRRLLPVLVFAALCLIAAMLPSGTVRAEDEDDGSLVLRLFDVSSLTSGTTDHIPPVMGIVGPDGVSDEENPLFGAEGEEPWLPVGTVDELIELIKNNVEPLSWEITEGSDVRTQGEGAIVARATRTVIRALESYLGQLERHLLSPVTVDLRIVRWLETGHTAVRPGKALTAEEAAILLEDRGPGLTLTARIGQRAVAYHGRQWSFVQDYDVEVAQSATISDPIVSVANFGLGASVRPMQGNDPSRVRLELDAVLCDHDETRTHATEDGKRIVELPIYGELRIQNDLVLTPGTWHVADAGPLGRGSEPYALLVRATPHTFTSRPAETFAEFPAVTPDTAALETRTFDVSDLGSPRENVPGDEIWLVPSNFTPPEPPELPEPMPIFPAESFVDLIREAVAPRSWSRKGTFVESRQGRIMARNTPKVLAAVERLLDGVRREFLFQVITAVEIVDVPFELADALTNGGEGRGGSYLLGPRARAALNAALTSGEASVVGRARLGSLAGARSSVISGRHVSYLQDFEVEIAEDATTANPVIQSVLDGLVVDLRPSLTTTRDAVQMEARVTQTDLALPLRQQTTPHGPLDVPTLDALKLRADLHIPLDATAVLGVGARGGGEGAQARLVLLTPHLERFGD